MLVPKAHSKELLRKLRIDIVEMAAHSAHVGAALSCVDILAALYFGVLNVSPEDPDRSDRDRFILSKGHGCMALYAVLAEAGFIPGEQLGAYGQNGSLLAEHPLADKVPGIEVATGSLGHGVAIAAGMAKAMKLLGANSRVFVLTGDGECDEGSVWESVAVAMSHQLDNLTAIVDWNGLQACGKCEDISRGISLPDCWKGFGWDVEKVDGHDFEKMVGVLQRPNRTGVPRVIFCKTKKGKGVDFMEDNLEWHYRPVRGKEKEDALRRLRNA